ncbi:histidine phosphatase family protein [Brevibacillus daliensis]|uniref:histidine phosphatase family protein n=1 Tax=Brevibacillus daliensis TaxID=2892995 RepID=UPI001E2B04AC|nr:histidine phosphatase family protein [Brevibacillus daliensis]
MSDISMNDIEDKTILYLIRHGETDWNINQRIQGHTNTDLNEAGKEQAAKLAEALSTESFAHIYSSDLKRAFETASMLGKRLDIPVTPLSTLRERCYGELEGKYYVDVQDRLEKLLSHESICGVESRDAMQERAVITIKHLLKQHMGQTIAIVSHGGFINAFLHGITEGLHGTGKSKIGNTGISIISLNNDCWEVHEISRDHHLQESKPL